MEIAMPPALPEWFAYVISMMAGIATSGGACYLAWRRVLLIGSQAKTDTSSLELVGAAVSHWKGLHDVAWEQVKAERDRRELAERRLVSALADIEKLRSEVAALRREIEELTALHLKGRSDGPPVPQV